MLVYLAVQKAFAKGLLEYDFLKGAENYKRLWTDQRREEFRLTLYNTSTRGAYHLARAQIKSLVKKMQSRLPGMQARHPLSEI